MNKVKQVFLVWKKILMNWKYSLMAILIAFLFLELNVIIKNAKSISSFYSSFGFLEALSYTITISKGFKQTISLSSFITLMIISVLLGFLFILITYKTNSIRNAKKISFLGATGVFLGVVAPGCAACSLGLLTFFGITGATLSFLPFKGLEISILAIIILGITIWQVSKGLLVCNSCQINLNLSGKLKNKQVKGGQ